MLTSNKKKNVINYEEISFTIIAYAGTAKSLANQAIDKAKINDIKSALAMIDEANSNIATASRAHMDVITKEGQGIQLPFSVLFMHAEDQLLTAQTMIDVSRHFINLYEFLHKKNKKGAKINDTY